MPPALLASFYAWIAAIAGVFLGYSFLDWLEGTLRLEEVAAVVVFAYLWPAGVVVFSTCLLMVTPLLGFLPASSKLWHPHRAAAVGAGVGPFAIFVILSGMLFFFKSPLHISVASFFNPLALVLALAASLAGAAFGFSYARLRQKTTGA